MLPPPAPFLELLPCIADTPTRVVDARVIKFIILHPCVFQRVALVEAKSGNTVQQVMDAVRTQASDFNTGDEDYQIAFGETNPAVTDLLGGVFKSAGFFFYPIVNIYPPARAYVSLESPADHVWLGLVAVVAVAVAVGGVAVVVGGVAVAKAEPEAEM